MLFLGGMLLSDLTAQITLFSADFENTSGDNNWTLGTGATDGDWEIGVPNPYTQSGTTVMEIAAFEGSQDLLTGNGSSQDLDGGPTTAESPDITLPAAASSIDCSCAAAINPRPAFLLRTNCNV